MQANLCKTLKKHPDLLIIYWESRTCKKQASLYWAQERRGSGKVQATFPDPESVQRSTKREIRQLCGIEILEPCSLKHEISEGRSIIHPKEESREHFMYSRIFAILTIPSSENRLPYPRSAISSGGWKIQGSNNN